MRRGKVTSGGKYKRGGIGKSFPIKGATGSDAGSNSSDRGDGGLLPDTNAGGKFAWQVKKVSESERFSCKFRRNANQGKTKGLWGGRRSGEKD